MKKIVDVCIIAACVSLIQIPYYGYKLIDKWIDAKARATSATNVYELENLNLKLLNNELRMRMLDKEDEIEELNHKTGSKPANV